MKNVLEYLESDVLKYPDKKAIVDKDGSIDYSLLMENSKRVGSFLLSKKVLMNRPVPVFADKCINTLTMFFGIAYSGCPYVYLNRDLPDSRLEKVLETIEAPFILTDSNNAEKAKEIAGQREVFVFEDFKDTPVNDLVLDDIRAKMIDTDPLYINFTSGSTGAPKGVVVSHRAVIDWIGIFTDTFGMNEEDWFANQAPFDFDVSVKDIYSSLKCGATLLVVPKELFSRPVELLDYLCEYPVTNMTWAVSALCLITTFHGLDYKVPDKLKRVLFSGEKMPYKALKQWIKALPDTTFVNLYGPTEITCNCTYYVVDNEKDYSDGLPIGTVFPNERILLLDENELVTEPGMKGEICVLGSELALGYYNNEAETRKAFVQNPVNPYFDERMYRTGDLGSYDENGILLFHGRKDFQIKYQGHRIELEDIETSMLKLDSVKQCCCIYYEEKKRLYGFYVGDSEPLDVDKELKELVPDYMVPKRMTRLEMMPLTKNGKIDRKALLESVLKK